MNIQLNQPYKIIPPMHRTYQRHYIIPAEDTLIVPLRIFGEEVSCDIRWKSHGELQVMRQAVFIIENLMPIDLIADEQLYELWKDYERIMIQQ